MVLTGSANLALLQGVSQSLASTAAEMLEGAVSLSGTAVGLPGLPASLAFSTSWVSGGVLAINNGTAPAVLSIQLDWDWVIDLGVDDAALGSTSVRSSSTCSRTACSSRTLSTSSVSIPIRLAARSADSFLREVMLGAAEARAYSFALSVTATGSAIEPAAIPEPTSLYLLLAGAAALLSASKRRRKTGRP